MTHMIDLLFWLLVGHAICDYPLQGDFLSRGKNHRNPIPGIPWWQCLAAHSLIHAGMVMLVTGRPVFALIEFVAHAATDYLKSEGALGFNEDQLQHVLLKIIFACFIAFA